APVLRYRKRIRRLRGELSNWRRYGKRSLTAGSGEVAGGRGQRAARPARLSEGRRRVRGGDHGLHGDAVRLGGAADGRAVEPRDGRGHAGAADAVAFREGGNAHALQPEER